MIFLIINSQIENKVIGIHLSNTIASIGVRKKLIYFDMYVGKKFIRFLSFDVIIYVINIAATIDEEP